MKVSEARINTSRGYTNLTIPSIAEQEELNAIEENVEDEPSGVEELALEPALSHGCQGCFRSSNLYFGLLSYLKLNVRVPPDKGVEDKPQPNEREKKKGKSEGDQLQRWWLW
jgi:hypothetical protein